MKYLKILPLAVITTLFAQDTFAIGEGAVRKADEIVNQQQQAGLLNAQNLTLNGLGLPQDAGHRAALVALGGAGIAVDAGNVAAAVALAGVPLAVDAGNVAAAVALAGVPLAVDAGNVAAAVALAGVPLAVNAGNVAAALALANANGGAIVVDADNVAAAVLLAPYVAGGGGRQVTAPQIAAIVAATAVNANTGASVAWAINTGFGGQPVGTVPAGLAQRQGALVNHPGDVDLRIVWLNAPNIVVGNVVAGPIANIVVGNNITVHTANLGNNNIAGGARIVFDAINQDAVANPKRTFGNMAITP